MTGDSENQPPWDPSVNLEALDPGRNQLVEMVDKLERLIPQCEISEFYLGARRSVPPNLISISKTGGGSNTGCPSFTSSPRIDP
jgi:hypothetical protein